MASPSLFTQLSKITTVKLKEVPTFLSTVFGRENLGTKLKVRKRKEGE